MKPFTTAAVAVFSLVVGVHLARIVLGWKVIVGESVVAVGGTAIPMWVSYLGVVIAGGLAVMVWRESR
jgi:TRAP-type C4-dicarboxylate transport system permease small subunit